MKKPAAVVGTEAMKPYCRWLLRRRRYVGLSERESGRCSFPGQRVMCASASSKGSPVELARLCLVSCVRENISQSLCTSSLHSLFHGPSTRR